MEAEAILKYLAEHGPQTTFRLASALGIERARVISILDSLAKKEIIEFKRGMARALKKALPKQAKLEKRKRAIKKKPKAIKLKKLKRLTIKAR